ncbi:NUDIX hydrolase domain-like protein [Naematelia encephala]|uniref:NUDIX hydrolase domain-like protein n=1 Tax=Naematelia encephala TaxID=71784 RepID=A0A1Y2B656_9TREE|nr:NUDIX hydrolase domain-like protein [Naematelia encephala]
MSSRHPRPIESLLLPLKPESLQCLHRFMEYERSPPVGRIPKRRSAAVAVILFVGRLGDLYVLLSTRAGNMRSYAHDTALPGGKYEEGDEDEEGTARREAWEEIGLPMDRDTVRKLCLLDLFLTGNGLIVTPVVFLVTDNSLNPILNPQEVTNLFSMPLSAFLHTRPSRIPGWHFGISTRITPASPESLSPPPSVDYAQDVVQSETNTRTRKGTRNGNGNASVNGNGKGNENGITKSVTVTSSYYGYRDVKWGQGIVRMHRFLTGREGGGEGVKPVYGLTAAILIHAARIGYAKEPEFDLLAPGQLSMQQRIQWDINNGQGPLARAVQIEGLKDDWVDTKSKL